LNGRPPAPEAGIVAAAADPFQRLDQAASPGAVLHSASNRIEVGVHDPAMGWLEIRTQSAAGQLSAALVATSSEAHAALAAQLPGMTQYLADHDVKLNHVAVEQQPSGAGPDGHSSSRQDGGGGGQQNHSAAYHVHDPPASWFPSGGDEEMEAEQLSYISVRA
jgi:flagellar hook-length control protein FliK